MLSSILFPFHDIHFVFRHNIIFKDVYREVGILEVFVTCLTRYANLLKDKEQEIGQNKGSPYYLPQFCKMLCVLV